MFSNVTSHGKNKKKKNWYIYIKVVVVVYLGAVFKMVMGTQKNEVSGLIGTEGRPIQSTSPLTN